MQMNAKYKKIMPLALTLGVGLLPTIVRAQDAVATATAAAPTTNNYENIRYVLVAFAILLLFVIVSLTNAVNAALAIKLRKIREQKISGKALGILVLLGSFFATQAVWAQDAAADAKAVVEEPNFFERIYNTMPNDVLITILVIIVELVVIFRLVKIQTNLLKDKTPEMEAKVNANRFTWAKFVEKLGANKATDNLEELDLNHDYDGIRELDNSVPGWWQLAFLGTFIFGIVYLFRMFVTGAIPDQITELNQAQAVAEVKMKEFLKSSANNVDENTVVMLDGSGIASGAEIYAKNCVACHGAAGEGGIGPNMTDNYYLHGGSIKDVFHTIKYGVPDKGMKAWEADFSPIQIAQLASFIESLKGTNPPNPKAPQGEEYKEDAAAAPAAADGGASEAAADSTAKK